MYIQNENRSSWEARKDQVPFAQLSSHSVDLEAISSEQQPERQEHEERGKRSP